MEAFYSRPSLITEDIDGSKVGVLDDSPAAELDVAGDVLVQDTLLVNSNVGVGSNLIVANHTQTKTINVGSNIYINGFSLYDECPQDTNEWLNLLPFREDLGYINESWIRRPVSAASVFQDLYNLAEVGIDLAELATNLWSMFQEDSPLTPALVEALSRALDSANDPNSSNAIRVSFSNLLDRPIATPSTSIGVQGDLLVSDASGLRVLPAARFSRTAQGNLQINNTSGSVPLLEYGNRTAHLQNLRMYDSDGSSNVWVSQNDPDFRLKQFRFNGGTITNTATPSNAPAPVGLTWWGNSNWLIVDGGRLVAVNAAQFQQGLFSDKITSFDPSKGGDLTFSNVETRIRHLDSAPPGESPSTYLTLKRDSVWFETQAATSNTGVKPKVLQLAVDSNGQVFVASNLLFPNRTALIRTFETPGIDNDFYTEARILATTSNGGRFIVETQSNNTTERIFIAQNEGIYLPRRGAIFAPPALIPVLAANGQSVLIEPHPPRLELDSNNGAFYFGYGFSNSRLTAPNHLEISARGEITTRRWTSNTYHRLIDSNADLIRCNMKLTCEGALLHSNQPVITDVGAIMRRADSNDINNGVLISPTGFVQAGRFAIATDGTVSSLRDINTACNMTACNVRTSNVLIYSSSGVLGMSDAPIRMKGATDANHEIRFSAPVDGVRIQGNQGGVLGIASGQANGLYWRNNASVVRIGVGQSASNPAAQLDVHGDAIFRSNLTASNLSACNLTIRAGVGASNLTACNLILSTGNLRLTDAGLPQIEFSPIVNRAGGASAIIRGADDLQNSTDIVFMTAPSNPLVQTEVATERMRIASTGLVTMCNGLVVRGFSTFCNTLNCVGTLIARNNMSCCNTITTCNLVVTSNVSFGNSIFTDIVSFRNIITMSNAPILLTPFSFPSGLQAESTNGLGANSCRLWAQSGGVLSVSRFDGPDSNALWWTPAGNVGIGHCNKAPTERLSVAGNILATGTVSCTSIVGAASNAIVFASNAGAFASNTAGSGAAAFSSNAAVFASNLSPAVVFSSNAGSFGSNASFFASNAAVFSSNAAVFGSNASSFGSNAGGFASNQLPNYRLTSVQVPWAQISGKPDFDGNQVGVGGVVLGTAGLLFGGAALLNQNGALVNSLTGAVGGVTSALRIQPDGYGRMKDFDLAETETSPINLSLRSDGWGSFNAGAKFGTGTITLSNDQITITNSAAGNQSNILIGSNLTFFRIANVGIGLSNPAERLHVDGNLAVSSNGFLELGRGWGGKENNAGRIGYQRFSCNLDVVGAGAAFPRGVRVWDRLGINADPTSSLTVAGDASVTGDVAANRFNARLFNAAGGLNMQFTLCNPGLNNAREFNYLNLNVASNSFIYGGIAPKHPGGWGSGFVELFGYGYSNNVDVSFQPIVIPSSRFGLGLSNPAAQFDVAGLSLFRSNVTMCNGTRIINSAADQTLITATNSNVPINLTLSNPFTKVDFGLAAVPTNYSTSSLSNDFVIRNTSGTSRILMLTGGGAPALTIQSNNAVVANQSLSVGSLAGACNIALSRFHIAGAVADGAAVMQANLTGTTWFNAAGYSSNPVWLTRIVNEDVAPVDNQLLGGIMLRSYPTAGMGTAPFGFPFRQLMGMSFVTRNGAASNIEAMSINAAGRVGIGTSNPASNLQVVGNAWVQGNLAGNALFEGGVALSGRYAVQGSNVRFSNVSLLDNRIQLRGEADFNHVLRHTGTPIDGPLLTGFVGGQLGMASGSNAIYWRRDGAGNPCVGIGHSESNATAAFSVAGAAVFKQTLDAAGIAEAGIGLSNRYAFSNTLVTVSNVIFPQATMASNAAAWASNNIVAGGGAQGIFASNAAAFASNALPNYRPLAGSINVTSNFSLNLGVGHLNKEGNAGRMGYGLFSCNVDLVGFGDATAGAVRSFRIWERLGIGMNTSNTLSVGGDCLMTSNLDVLGSVRAAALTGSASNLAATASNRAFSFWTHQPVAGTFNAALLPGLVTACNLFADAGIFAGQNAYMGNLSGAPLGGCVLTHTAVATSTSYALCHASNGATFLNAGSGRDLSLRTNNVDRAIVNATGLACQGRVDAIGNLTTQSNVFAGNGYMGRLIFNSSSNAFFGIMHSNLSGSAGTSPANYALIAQDDGTTYLNAANGRNINLRINQADVAVLSQAQAMTISGTGLRVTGFSNHPSRTFGFLNPAGQTGTFTSTGSYSIVCDQRVLAAEFNAISDRRTKENIVDFEKTAAEKIVGQMRARHYTYKTDGMIKVGFVADELEKVFPNAVVDTVKTISGDDKPLQAVDYSQVTVLNTCALQAMMNRLDKLENEVKELRGMVMSG